MMLPPLPPPPPPRYVRFRWEKEKMRDRMLDSGYDWEKVKAAIEEEYPEAEYERLEREYEKTIQQLNLAEKLTLPAKRRFPFIRQFPIFNWRLW